MPRPRCKCGLLATEGVVPSELGHGWFCGNAYGDYREGKTCDWESFWGREELMLKVGSTQEPWKSRKTNEIRDKIRDKYDVLTPDLCAERGPLPHSRGVWGIEEIIAYWRRNRSKYP
ncbi:hypothetical protein BAE44_0014613 [Dichanthelium oligosanthes]|uniref:Uncharacterized protein n=1 Tax=Dichanthelium oligosanthes TaxID=888268 RepID=A0A1E5VGY1_9POAL|nr:hypothetical protein BAE44_0014613 [Dichanthelium oligosanthes]